MTEELYSVQERAERCEAEFGRLLAYRELANWLQGPKQDDGLNRMVSMMLLPEQRKKLKKLLKAITKQEVRAINLGCIGGKL
jgi:hypothetical protein